jgi:hypothetical protein
LSARMVLASTRTMWILCRKRGIAFALCALVGLLCSCNPFAPDIDTSIQGGGSTLADQSTIEGVFQNFHYAYTFRDTTMYGRLLAQDFVFTYRDYDKVVDLSWGRDEDMRITSRLFDNAQSLNLVWNNIVGFGGDSLRADVTRSFNLTVTFNPSDIVRVDGRVSLHLQRNASSEPWKISLWKDESNY